MPWESIGRVLMGFVGSVREPFLTECQTKHRHVSIGLFTRNSPLEGDLAQPLLEFPSVLKLCEIVSHEKSRKRKFCVGAVLLILKRIVGYSFTEVMPA